MTKRCGWALVGLALTLAATACEDDGTTSGTRGTTGATGTTTTVAGGTSGPADGDAASSASDPAGDDDASTPAASSPVATAGRSDGETGLTRGTPAAPPTRQERTDAVTGEASIVVEGPFPLSLSGGLCSYYDSTVWVQAGQVGADFITLSWRAPSPAPAVVTDPAQISAVQVGWESGGGNALSSPELTEITFDATGVIAGSFTGHAVRALPGETDQIDFSGRFSCRPAPIEIRGPQRVALTRARCSEAGVSAGTPTTDAALLSVDPASLGDDDLASGALSYRSAGVVYTSQWVQIEFSRDRVAGSFVASMVGPGGSPFRVEGAFSCL